MLLLSEANQRRGQYEGAEEAARRALKVAGQSVARQAEALSVLARALVWRGANAEALAILDELELRVKQLGRPSLAQAWGYAMRGSILASEAKYVLSGQWFDKGIELALKVDGVNSITAAEMRFHRGWQIASHRGGRNLARETLNASLNALRRLGGAAATQADLRHASGSLQMLYVRYMTHAEAKSAIARAQAAVDQYPAVPDSTRTVVRRLPLELKLAWGDYEIAGPRFIDELDQELLSYQSPHTKFFALEDLIALGVFRGEHSQLMRWIDERHVLRSAMGESTSPNVAWDWILKAFVLSSAGKHDLASQALDEVEDSQRYTFVHASRHHVNAIRWARIQVLMDAGRFEDAWRAYGDGVAPLEIEGQETPTLWYLLDDQVTAARLLCSRRTRAPEGLQQLQQKLTDAAPYRYQHAPDMIWLNGLAGLCAVTSGESASARRHFKSAKSSIAVQPYIAEYFRRPGRFLEVQLNGSK